MARRDNLVSNHLTPGPDRAPASAGAYGPKFGQRNLVGCPFLLGITCSVVGLPTGRARKMPSGCRVRGLRAAMGRIVEEEFSAAESLYGISLCTCEKAAENSAFGSCFRRPFHHTPTRPSGRFNLFLGSSAPSDQRASTAEPLLT